MKLVISFMFANIVVVCHFCLLRILCITCRNFFIRKFIRPLFNIQKIIHFVENYDYHKKKVAFFGNAFLLIQKPLFLQIKTHALCLYIVLYAHFILR